MSHSPSTDRLYAAHALAESMKVSVNAEKRAETLAYLWCLSIPVRWGLARAMKGYGHDLLEHVARKLEDEAGKTGALAWNSAAAMVRACAPARGAAAWD